MAEHHPDRTALHQLLLGDLSVPEAGLVQRHLATNCSTCRAILVELSGAEPMDSPGTRPGSWHSAEDQFAYDRAFDRAFRRASEASSRIEAERVEAAELVPQLLRHPLARQLWIVRNSRQYARWAVCERLLEGAWGLRFDDPNRALEVAEVATAVAERIEPSHYGAPLVADLRARAWATLANARRVVSDHAGAEGAFQAAEVWLGSGTGSPLERASVLDLRASLSSALQRYQDADDQVARAIAVYRQTDQKHVLGRALIKRGQIRTFLEDRDAEISLVREGLELIDVEAEPQLVAAGWLNLLYALHRRGDDREALALLARARPIHLRAAHRTTRIRFQWLEGNIAAALGRQEQAEGCLRQVRRSFVEEGIAVDAALAALDLAGLFAEQGRYAEVKALAAETLEIFRSRQIATPAITAMLLFQRAAERERVTAALLERVAEAVRRAESGRPPAPPPSKSRS